MFLEAGRQTDKGGRREGGRERGRERKRHFFSLRINLLSSLPSVCSSFHGAQTLFPGPFIFAHHPLAQPRRPSIEVAPGGPLLCKLWALRLEGRQQPSSDHSSANGKGLMQLRQSLSLPSSSTCAGVEIRRLFPALDNTCKCPIVTKPASAQVWQGFLWTSYCRCLHSNGTS